MLQALADSVRDQVHATYDVKGRLEGDGQGGWMLVDFGDVVVHLFSKNRRDYYQLEELWEKGKILLRLQ